MKKTLRPLVLLSAVGALFFGVVGTVLAHDHDNEKDSATLTYKSTNKWTINLPRETFTPVKAEIPIAHDGATGFHTEMEGLSLAVDTNGDGSVDAKAKGVGGFMMLKAKDLSYAVRLVNNKEGWKYAASGFMAGTIKGTEIRLIDQDNNGRYNDYGSDAMIVGKGDAASFLSHVVNLSGSLYNLEVNAEGTEISVTPYTGQAAILNLESGFTTQGILESVVVASKEADCSFNLAREKKGLLVPAGSYSIAYGTVTQGAESVKIRAGKMKPISVGANGIVAPKWGGPIKAEFTWTHDKGVLTIAPTDLFFFGAAGEEYYSWVPDGQPPTFVVKDAKTGKEILKARFGGC